jgi:hypothetical protein
LLLRQVRRQAVQRPTAERQPQFLGIGQAGGKQFADLRRAVRRRPSTAPAIAQPLQPIHVEARDPQSHRPVGDPETLLDRPDRLPLVGAPADQRAVAQPRFGRPAVRQLPQRLFLLAGQGT